MKLARASILLDQSWLSVRYLLCDDRYASLGLGGLCLQSATVFCISLEITTRNLNGK